VNSRTCSYGFASGIFGTTGGSYGLAPMRCVSSDRSGVKVTDTTAATEAARRVGPAAPGANNKHPLQVFEEDDLSSQKPAKPTRLA
jgi:hypothetical protein